MASIIHIFDSSLTEFYRIQSARFIQWPKKVIKLHALASITALAEPPCRPSLQVLQTSQWPKKPEISCPGRSLDLVSSTPRTPQQNSLLPQLKTIYHSVCATYIKSCICLEHFLLLPIAFFSFFPVVYVF